MRGLRRAQVQDSSLPRVAWEEGLGAPGRLRRARVEHCPPPCVASGADLEALGPRPSVERPALLLVAWKEALGVPGLRPLVKHSALLCVAYRRNGTRAGVRDRVMSCSLVEL